MKTYHASVLAIGTELTTGQIVNKNASTLSEKLKRESVLAKIHITVPDQKDLMLEALEICASHSDWIFVTGGLGPTSDDFTRDVVAEWAGKKMFWDQASWEHLTERLTSRGYTVKEIQKQQCYFPEGARILINKEGTAHGFHISAKGKEVFVLPGPPREIDACWNFGIQNWLEEKTKDVEKYVTRSWDTLGLGESDLALVVQPFVDEAKKILGIQAENLDIGYRVHLPYVEFKLSFFKSQEQALNSVFEKITTALKAWTVAQDGTDVLKSFLKKIKSENMKSVHIIDELSGTFLLNRLNPQLKNLLADNGVTFSFSNQWTPVLDDSGIVISLKESQSNQAEVGLLYRGQNRRDTITSPYTTANMAERRQQYFAEYALILWNRWLS